MCKYVLLDILIEIREKINQKAAVAKKYKCIQKVRLQKSNISNIAFMKNFFHKLFLITMKSNQNL